jgi:glycosyltransferase involved in cell wall biosynthesis
MASSNKPLVSIGIPVYNGESSIRRALDSALEQTYSNLQIVISDNGSTDRTGEICLAYAAKDQRVRYHRSQINIGATANFRRVVELSSSEYFMWAAADDIKPLTAVDRLLQALLRNKGAVLAHGIVLLKVPGREDLVTIPNEMDVSGPDAAKRVQAFTRGLASQCIVYGLFRRSALTSGIFSKCYGQEYLLCLQMCLLGSFEYVKTPMIIYSVRRADFSANPMYTELPITLMDLLTDCGLRRWKCWTTLFIGSYYLAKMGGIKWRERARAVGAHVITFGRLYRAYLGKEIIFQLFVPISWVSFSIWHLASRWNASSLLARKLKIKVLRF